MESAYLLSTSEVTEKLRRLLAHEFPLFTHLVSLAGIKIDVHQLIVEPMQDGGMGSMLINPPRADRRMSARVASVEFEDVDGIPVSATLNVDQDDHLFELDVWKVDFSPLQRWPMDDDLRG